MEDKTTYTNAWTFVYLSKDKATLPKFKYDYVNYRTSRLSSYKFSTTFYFKELFLTTINNFNHFLSNDNDECIIIHMYNKYNLNINQ